MLARSFVKFVLFVVIVSFIAAAFFYQSLMGPDQGTPFLAKWVILFLIFGFVCFITMAAVLSVGAVAKEFNREVGLWHKRPSSPLWSSKSTIAIPADQAFSGLHGQDDAVLVVVDTIAAAQSGLKTHPD